MAWPRALVEAVTLSLFLTDAARRRALLAARPRPERDGDGAGDADAADQRRDIDLQDLTDRLREPPADLRAVRRVCEETATQRLDAAGAAGMVAVTWRDERYPARLSVIGDPPAVLWVRGRVELLDTVAVAIVGSRTASRYARSVAERLGSDLAGRGVTVVSGLARGVDGAAHRGALSRSGPTAAVLGSGVDVVYPREHAELMDAVVRQGAVLSEWGPGAPPLAYHFPLRNRLISGLSAAVVVVEATSRSGSLITARCAADQGREVMAVPGNVLSGRSEGAHALIRDGAKIVESVDDILEELPAWTDSGDSGPGAAARRGTRVDPEPDPILRQMDPGEVYDVEALSRCSGLSGSGLLGRLTDLELDGRLERVGPGRFVRVLREVVT